MPEAKASMHEHGQNKRERRNYTLSSSTLETQIIIISQSYILPTRPQFPVEYKSSKTDKEKEEISSSSSLLATQIMSLKPQNKFTDQISAAKNPPSNHTPSQKLSPNSTSYPTNCIISALLSKQSQYTISIS